jgi:hypothetical protein
MKKRPALTKKVLNGLARIEGYISCELQSNSFNEQGLAPEVDTDIRHGLKYLENLRKWAEFH